MALERESKYVSIGNMPYVAPQTGNALSGVTDAIGDEIQKRRKQEDELATSELTASMFDLGTNMTNNMEGSPDSALFKKEFSIGINKIITGSKPNSRVKHNAQLLSNRLVSSFTNSMANKEIDHLGNRAVVEHGNNERNNKERFQSLSPSERKTQLELFKQGSAIQYGSITKQTYGKISLIEANKQKLNYEKELDYIIVGDDYNADLLNLGSQKAEENAFQAISKIEPSPDIRSTILNRIKSTVSPSDFDQNKELMLNNVVDIMKETNNAKQQELIKIFGEKHGYEAAESFAKTFALADKNNTIKEQQIKVDEMFSTLTTLEDVQDQVDVLLITYANNKAMQNYVANVGVKNKSRIFIANENQKITDRRSAEKTQLTNTHGDAGSSLINRIETGAIRPEDVSNLIDPLDLKNSPNSLRPDQIGYQGNQPYNVQTWTRIREALTKITNAKGLLANFNPTSFSPNAEIQKAADVLWDSSGLDQRWQNAMNIDDREQRVGEVDSIITSLTERGIVPTKIIDQLNNVASGSYDGAIKLYEVFEMLEGKSDGNFDFVKNLDQDALNVFTLVRGSYNPNILATDENKKQWQKVWDEYRGNKQNAKTGGSDLNEIANQYLTGKDEFTDRPLIEMDVAKVIGTLSEGSSLWGGLKRSISAFASAKSNGEELFNVVTKDTKIGNALSSWDLRGLENANPIKVLGAINRFMFGDTSNVNLSPDVKDFISRQYKARLLQTNGAISNEAIIEGIVKKYASRIVIDPGFRARGATANAVKMLTTKGPSSTSNLNPSQVIVSLIETATLSEVGARVKKPGEINLMPSLNVGSVPGEFTDQSALGREFRQGYFSWTQYIGETILANESGVKDEKGNIHWGKLYAQDKLAYNSPKQINGETLYKITYYDDLNRPFDLPSSDGTLYHKVRAFSKKERTKNSLGPHPSRVLGDGVRNITTELFD